MHDPSFLEKIVHDPVFYFCLDVPYVVTGYVVHIAVYMFGWLLTAFAMKRGIVEQWYEVVLGIICMSAAVYGIWHIFSLWQRSFPIPP